MSLYLYHREYGAPNHPPLVVLHGLLGSSRNWQTIANELSSQWQVFALDLRNHGNSPHSDEMNYDCMEEDLIYWMDQMGLEDILLMGHSLGGKLAMGYACSHPDRVAGLVIVDIAPRDYPPHHEFKFDVMNLLDPSKYHSRGAVEHFLKTRIEDWALRKFLVTNLVRDEETGTLKWQINLKVLTEYLPELAFSPLGWDDQYDGPVLFIRGGDSDFIEEDDKFAMNRHFPANKIITIDGAGHNVHMENRPAFMEAVKSIYPNL